MGISTKMTRSCNLGCSYCYQNSARTVFNATSAHDYDIEAMLATISAGLDREVKLYGKAKPVVLHGGEPLLARKEDVERIMALSHKRTGSVSIQTNGVLLDDEWIELFRKYRVGVGISIDGPGELNLGRQMGGDKAATLKATEKTLENMEKLSKLQMPPGLIVVMSKHNCSKDRLPKLLEFLEWCQTLGIQGARLNPAHVDIDWLVPSVQLTNDELAHAWRTLIPWSMERNFEIRTIRETFDGLLGLGSHLTCTRTYCDPLHTEAERPVQETGAMGQCEHVYGKEGVTYLAAEDQQALAYRYAILKDLPEKYNGCKGCVFWAICSGECPGQGVDGDWRNRSRFCESWKVLYRECDRYLKMVMPNIVTLPDIAEKFDQDALYHAVRNNEGPWNPYASMQRGGENPPSSYRRDARRYEITTPVCNPNPRPTGNFTDHADHLDHALGRKNDRGGNFTDHGDVPHGDAWS